jgi:hypothetical protein
MKKVIKMNKELHEAVIRQLESFKEKFGREAGPDDPLFLILIMMSQLHLLSRR